MKGFIEVKTGLKGENVSFIRKDAIDAIEQLFPSANTVLRLRNGANVSVKEPYKEFIKRFEEEVE